MIELPSNPTTHRIRHRSAKPQFAALRGSGVHRNFDFNPSDGACGKLVKPAAPRSHSKGSRKTTPLQQLRNQSVPLKSRQDRNLRPTLSDFANLHLGPGVRKRFQATP